MKASFQTLVKRFMQVWPLPSIPQEWVPLIGARSQNTE